MNATLQSWADAIAATPLSAAFSHSFWVVPTSQSIHILGIAVVFSFSLMISIKLLGPGRSGRSTSELVATARPWFWSGFGVLLATGLVQAIAEPSRQFSSQPFRFKLVLLLVLVVLAGSMFRAVRANPAGWDAAGGRTLSQRLTGLGLLAVLVAIIFCGRFIAYTTTN